MKYIDELIDRKPILKTIKTDIVNSYKIIYECFYNKNKLLICGNGGSSADASHITGELMKKFVKSRILNENFKMKLNKCITSLEQKQVLIDTKQLYIDFLNNLEQGLPCIDLSSFQALNTAYINDKSDRFMYANSVLGFGNEGDVLICITTSGNSQNVFNAAIVAKSKNMQVISLTGRDGGNIKYVSDSSIIVPLNDTYLIQEEHMSIYHSICLQLEEDLF